MKTTLLSPRPNKEGANQTSYFLKLLIHRIKTKIHNSCILSITIKALLVFSLQDSGMCIYLPMARSKATKVCFPFKCRNVSFCHRVKSILSIGYLKNNQYFLSYCQELQISKYGILQFPLSQLCTIGFHKPQVEPTEQQQNRLLSYFHPFAVGRSSFRKAWIAPFQSLC